MQNSAQQTSHIINGVNTDEVIDLATRISQDEKVGKSSFRASNKWLEGTRSRSTIQGFHTNGAEDLSRSKAHTVDADQPAFLAGDDTAPNPVEYVLHALCGCLCVTLVAHASVQGIQLGTVETRTEGDMDARGFFGISDKVSKGYERIRVEMFVESDADIDTLTALAMHSPVYEMMSKASSVKFAMIKI
ncbi:OsmC family protein [Gammaproteobacteria bacterium]|nr:OsmC family protein [Gammaproteobacteria bacterium]